MAITVDRSVYPYVIQIPKADMVQIQINPSEIRQLDAEVFRGWLHDLQDNAEHMPFTRMFYHNTTVSVGGASLARVIVITDDYVLEFEDGAYRVNVVGANTNFGEKAVVNNVSVSTSNSAGLQDLNSLQAASYDGAVAVKVSSPYSGTTFPVGTRGYPVNNIADAHIIAEDRGLHHFAVMESMTLTSETLTDGYVFVGDSPVTTTLTLEAGADTTNCEFQNLTVTGVLDGNNIFRQCVVYNISYTNGFIFQCAIVGTVTLGGGAQASIFDCYSGVAGGGPGQTPTIDMNGNEQNSIALRGYDGGLTIINNTAPAGDISLDFDSGRLILDSTVAAGDIYVRGICNVTDNTTGTAVLYDQTISKTTATTETEATFTRKLLDADEVLAETGGGTWTLIDPDDGITVLRTRQVRDKDGNAITLPTGAPAQRTKV